MDAFFGGVDGCAHFFGGAIEMGRIAEQSFPQTCSDLSLHQPFEDRLRINCRCESYCCNARTFPRIDGRIELNAIDILETINEDLCESKNVGLDCFFAELQNRSQSRVHPPETRHDERAAFIPPGGCIQRLCVIVEVPRVCNTQPSEVLLVYLSLEFFGE